MNENTQKNLDRREKLDRRLKAETKLEKMVSIQELTKPELKKQELTKLDKLMHIKCDKTYLVPKLLEISNQEVSILSEQS